MDEMVDLPLLDEMHDLHLLLIVVELVSILITLAFLVEMDEILH
jgi:hypothetical protein